MNLIEKVRRHGIVASVRQALRVVARRSSRIYHLWRVRNAPRYANPTPTELAAIERDLVASGVTIHDYTPSPQAFGNFMSSGYFPADYCGGRGGAVWDEKLLEHWIAAECLGLMGYAPFDIYVDIAAGGSPWAKALRENHALSAFALDRCEIGDAFQALPFYRREDATATSFANASVTGVSLHCAYEMFSGEDDIKLLHELARILKRGGKAVILPLYLHREYCAYSTPEYYGRGHVDPAATEYVRTDCLGIPASRKYDVRMLKSRVLAAVEELGMSYRVLTLRNPRDLGQNIYCHFILEIIK